MGGQMNASQWIMVSWLTVTSQPKLFSQPFPQPFALYAFTSLLPHLWCVSFFPTSTLLGVLGSILDVLSFPHKPTPGKGYVRRKDKMELNSNLKSPLIVRRQLPWGGDGNKTPNQGIWVSENHAGCRAFYPPERIFYSSVKAPRIMAIKENISDGGKDYMAI